MGNTESHIKCGLPRPTSVLNCIYMYSLSDVHKYKIFNFLIATVVLKHKFQISFA